MPATARSNKTMAKALSVKILVLQARIALLVLLLCNSLLPILRVPKACRKVPVNLVPLVIPRLLFGMFPMTVPVFRLILD